jgi:hypothetical protein
MAQGTGAAGVPIAIPLLGFPTRLSGSNFQIELLRFDTRAHRDGTFAVAFW